MADIENGLRETTDAHIPPQAPPREHGPTATIISEEEQRGLPTSNAQPGRPYPSTEAADPENPARNPARVYDLEEPRYAMLEAAKSGDWERAEAIIRDTPEASTAALVPNGRNALHIAAMHGRSMFVKRLLEHNPPECSTCKDRHGRTALHLAAGFGHLGVVKILVEKEPSLTELTNNRGRIPILARFVGLKKTKELVRFLAERTENPFIIDNDGRYLLEELALSGYHDITLFLLKKHPHMATYIDKDGNTLLNLLALRPWDFRSGGKFAFWDKLAREVEYHDLVRSFEEGVDISSTTTAQTSYTWRDRALRYCKGLAWWVIKKLAPGRSKSIIDSLRINASAEVLVKFICRAAESRACPSFRASVKGDLLYKAARAGILEIVRACFEIIPQLWVSLVEGNLNTMHVAIAYRQAKILAFLLPPRETHENCFRHKVIEWPPKQEAYCANESEKIVKCTILHLAGTLAPPQRRNCVSGAVLQMQREIQWFKEVESLVDPLVREKPGKMGMTAWEMFTEEHKALVEKAENWMKDTSNSCMVVATLIATVIFAAAFTVPGGNNEEKGIPFFSKKLEFIIFIVSDALALFSSITSLLMFLSILASRFAEEDFVWKLPAKLIAGLGFLFIAMASMMIAFVSSLWIVASDSAKWISILTTVLAAIPVFVFLILQLPMFVEMCKSTFGYGIFDTLHRREGEDVWFL